MPTAPHEAWLAKASHDYLAIHNNVVASEIPWDVVCFHAQQCAEKLLKAYLVFAGQAPQRIHDLDALLSRCIAINPDLMGLETDCSLLSVHAVGSRYPDPLYEPNAEDARDAIAALDRIRERLLPLFS